MAKKPASLTPEEIAAVLANEELKRGKNLLKSARYVALHRAERKEAQRRYWEKHQAAKKAQEAKAKKRKKTLDAKVRNT